MAIHRYRSRNITAEEILFIRQLIQDRPELSRWKLSRQLCEAWQWKQANGALRDMVCRGLLLMLHRAGEIELPPVKRKVPNRLAERERPEPVIPDTRPVRGPLASITPLDFIQVRRTPEEALFNSLMEQYHYLGYEQPVGEHLKYLVKADGQAIACLAWQSAPRHLKVRDRFLAWSEESRERNVHLLAYNTRFLILPWVQVEHLASHVLGRMAKLVPQDWQRLRNLDRRRTKITMSCWRRCLLIRRPLGRAVNQTCTPEGETEKVYLDREIREHFQNVHMEIIAKPCEWGDEIVWNVCAKTTPSSAHGTGCSFSNR